MPKALDFNDRNLSLGLARVSEAAAIACAPLIGRGDEKAADQAAVDAMRTQLNKLDIAGVVVATANTTSCDDADSSTAMYTTAVDMAAPHTCDTLTDIQCDDAGGRDIGGGRRRHYCVCV